MLNHKYRSEDSSNMSAHINYELISEKLDSVPPSGLAEKITKSTTKNLRETIKEDAKENSNSSEDEKENERIVTKRALFNSPSHLEDSKNKSSENEDLDKNKHIFSESCNESF